LVYLSLGFLCLVDGVGARDVVDEIEGILKVIG
jgi:hypothetical protein